MSRCLYMLGCTHRTAPLEIREKFSVTGKGRAKTYEGFKHLPGLKELLVLNTCNRVELYCVSDPGFSTQELFGWFCGVNNIPVDSFESHSFWLHDKDVIKHLFEVTAGVDSQLMGETEILGQVKEAYAIAHSMQTLGPVLNRVFQRAFQTAKWARTNTAIGLGQVSIGSVATDLALRIFGDLDKTKILKIGTGEAGETTLHSLKHRGAKHLTITNRTFSRAEELAKKLGANALPYEVYGEKLGEFDIVICSTSSGKILIDEELVKSSKRKRKDAPLFFIDLAVPRNICSSAGKLTNTYLYNMDDLAKIANENMKARATEVEKCLAKFTSKADLVWQDLGDIGNVLG